MTLTLVHGSDSYLPGVATFGQPPEQLTPCGCGKWRQPTREQVAAMHERLEALRRAREQGKG